MLFSVGTYLIIFQITHNNVKSCKVQLKVVQMRSKIIQINPNWNLSNGASDVGIEQAAGLWSWVNECDCILTSELLPT